MKIRKNWFYFLIICINTFIFLLSVWLWINTYENFTYQFLAQLRRLDKLSTFREHFLTPNIFFFLRIFILSIFLCLIFIIFFWKHKIIIFQKKINNFFYQVWEYILKFYQIFLKLKKKENIFLWTFFTLISIFKIYLVFNLSVHIDEAFNYTFIASKGIWVSMTYYPGPNNHILYTSIVSILHNLNLPPVIAIRLPNLLFSQLSFLLTFAFFYHKNKKFWQAFLLASIFWNFAPITYYGFLGRGYMLSTFLSILLIWISLKKVDNNIHSFNTLFIIISILGFYTIPTFLYLWLSICLFLLLKVSLKNLFIPIFGTILCAFLLYLPIIFFNGVNILIANSWVQSLSLSIWFNNFISYFWSLGEFFFGFQLGFTLLIILYFCIIFFSIKYRNRKDYLFVLILLLLPFILIFFQRVLPFERVWTYQTFAIIWLTHLIISKFYKKLYYFFLATILLFFISKNNFILYKFSLKTPDYHILSKKIIGQKSKDIYVNEDLYFTFLNYYKVILNSNTNIHTKLDKNLHYDYLILGKNHSQKFNEKEYKFMEGVKEVNIFQKK